MKTLLVPTDFSHEAGVGVEYAIALATRGDYKLVLLHAFRLDLADLLYTQIVTATSSFRSAALRQLIVTRNLISTKLSSIPDYIFEESTLEDAIRKVVKERKIDFIVMGTHGAKGIKKLLIGSHTSGIIRSARCPVLSIPQHTQFKGFKKVVFATNCHHGDISELRSLVDLVKLYQAKINILHASRDSDDRFIPIMTAFEKNVRKQIHYPHFTFQVLGGNQPEEALNDYLELEQVDLFAISTRKRLLIERLAGPGISENFSLECRFPLLVFHQATPPLVF